MAFSPNGERIATASGQTAKLWDAFTGENLLTFEGHSASIWSISFSPDGQRIITGSDDQTVRVWDAVNGATLRILKGHSAPIWSVAFSRDGRRIVTGSGDDTAKVWETVSGRQLLTLKGHSAGIRSVAFSPHGERIITGSEDHTIKVWQAASAAQVAEWQRKDQAAVEYLATFRREQDAERERQRLAHVGDESAIKTWLILAPIALTNKSRVGTMRVSWSEELDVEQIKDEAQLQPKAGEATLTLNGELKWETVTQKDYVIDFNNLLRHDPFQPSVAYAVCYIRAETEQHGLRMLIGSDDQSKVYLNGRQIYKWPTARSFVADLDEVSNITLNAGRNVLVFKVVNEVLDWQGSIRFTDAQGNPLKGINVTLEP